MPEIAATPLRRRDPWCTIMAQLRDLDARDQCMGYPLRKQVTGLAAHKSQQRFAPID